MKNKKLGDYVDIVSGYAFKSKEFDIKGVPVIRMSDLYQNKIRITANTARVVDINIDEKFLIQKGDILLGMSGSIGKMGIADINGKMYLNQRIAKIVPKNNEISRVFLIYLIRQICERMKQDSLGGTVPNISPNTLKNYDVWVPSIENQKEIANTLNLASKLIEKRKEQIAEMDKLIQSVFYEMFGDPVTNSKTWKKKKLSEMGIIARGKSKHRPRNAPELLGGNYPLIQTGDVANSGIFIKEYKSTYSELGLMQSKMWDRGTLCITIAANIAKTGILSFDACFPDSIVGMICNENTNEIFMQVWFSFFQQILEKNAPESAQKNINLQILGGLEVICPPIKMQNKFASIVEEIESQKKAMEESLDEMENNFNALMQKSFRGELFPEE